MRVLAINDLSCIGKCSLSVSLPIISACGVTCDVLPTALLSTHTGGFENYFFRDLTEDIRAILAHWRNLDIRFDIVYSGYLGDIAQIDTVMKIREEFLADDGLFIVDPVMGDGGKLYAGFNETYVEKMRTLCRMADYILPNVTEACYLTGANFDKYDISAVLQKLHALCPSPIVTGHLEPDGIAVRYLRDGKEERYTTENVEGFFCGAGDVFASAFVGALARGKDERTAIRLAADLTSAAIRRSAVEVEDKRYGLNFETEIFSFLKNLNMPSNR